MAEIERGLALITQLDRELAETTLRASEMASTQITAPESDKPPPCTGPSPLPMFNKVLAMSDSFSDDGDEQNP